ncbi:hypothetical protein SAMN04490220_0666 [Rhodococcus jostii]|uniref:Uncharacterized protein n=1 Tax=Rhodococcus jostii TaxID=132919 RepID=A0A1H4J6E7_RHOJO|nr:hypothetical protein SAMN04490220_0666 [Rhodococcus jostii]
MLQINVFQKRLKPDAADTRAPADTPAPALTRQVADTPHHKPGACHHSRSQHYYAQGCRGRIDPTHNHLHTTQNGQQGIQQ